MCQQTELHPSKQPSLETVLGLFVSLASRCQRQRSQRSQGVLLDSGLVQSLEQYDRPRKDQTLLRRSLPLLVLMSPLSAGWAVMNPGPG